MEKYIFGIKPDDCDEVMSRPSALPAVMVPAMAYVPLQFYDNIFEVEEGYCQGTIFPELVKPFMGGGSR